MLQKQKFRINLRYLKKPVPNGKIYKSRIQSLTQKKVKPRLISTRKQAVRKMKMWANQISKW